MASINPELDLLQELAAIDYDQEKLAQLKSKLAQATPLHRSQALLKLATGIIAEREAIYLAMMEFLLTQDLDLNYQDNKGETILGALISGGGENAALIGQFLQKIPSPQRERFILTPLPQAPQRFTVIDLAVNLNNFPALGQLLVHIKNPVAANNLFLKWFNSENMAALKEALASNLISSEDKDNYLLTTAARRMTAVAKLLIEHGADINTTEHMDLPWQDYNVLMIACNTENKELVEFLLQKGAVLKIGDDFDIGRQTPFSIAIVKKDVAIIKLLLDYGADVNEPINRNEHASALMVAARFGANDVVKLLLNHKADVNQVNSFNDSALYLAAQNNHLDTVKLLLEAHAVVDHADVFGTTSLMWAATHTNLEMINVLLQYGAQVNLADNKGRTAIDCTNNPECKNILREAINTQNRTHAPRP